MVDHIAIMDRRTIRSIVERRKVLESRFSLSRLPPFGRVKPGDSIYLKEKGGCITAKFTAGRVDAFADLTEPRVQAIRDALNGKILADDDYWARKLHSRYGTLIEIVSPTELMPFTVRFKGRRGWITLSDDAVVAESIMAAINSPDPLGRRTRKGTGKAE